MSRCSCCGGTQCKFPCCSDKKLGKLCLTVEECRLLYIAGGAGGSDNFNVEYFFDYYRCNYGPYPDGYIQRVSFFNSVSGSVGRGRGNGNLDVAESATITIDSELKFGNASVSYYFLFPGRFENGFYQIPGSSYYNAGNVQICANGNPNYPDAYTDTFGFGVSIGGLGKIIYTYDYSNTQQYRMRVHHATRSIDISFGDFGLCKCCNNATFTVIESLASTSSLGGPNGLVGNIYRLVTVGNFPIEDSGQLIASLRINSSSITHDVPIKLSGVKLSCPASSYCATKTDPTSIAKENDVNDSGKSNVDGWGQILVQSDISYNTTGSVTVYDNSIGVLCPKDRSEEDCVSAINYEGGDSAEDAWVSVKSLFEYWHIPPFQLKDLPDNYFYDYELVNRNGVNYYQNKKTTDPILLMETNGWNSLSLSRFKEFLSDKTPGYTFNCERLNGSAEGNLQIDPSDNLFLDPPGDLLFLDGGSSVLDLSAFYLTGLDPLGGDIGTNLRLIYFKISANVMDASILDCTYDEYDHTPNKYCDSCYAVNVAGLGYVSKYFKLYEAALSGGGCVGGSSGGLNDVHMIYDGVSWKSQNYCRVVGTDTATVNFELLFDSDGAYLTKNKNGVIETYTLNNDGDCKLITNSLTFINKQDATPITESYICGFAGTTVYYDVPTHYLCVPFFLLYPNNR